MNPGKLKFGLMMNPALILQEWQKKSVEHLLSSGLAECKLVIMDGNPAPHRSYLKKIIDFISNKPLYHLYTRFLCRTRSRVNTDSSDMLAGVTVMSCKTIRKGEFSEYFDKDDIEKIRSQGLDFILRFGFNIIRGEILDVARYGVWSFHHGDEKTYRGGPTGFWEIFRNENVNGAILQRLTDRIDAGIVLKKGYFSVINHSYPAHIDQLLFSTAGWPLMVCRDILNGVAAYFDKEPSSTQAVINKVPGNTRMLIFLGKLLYNRFRFHYRDLFFEEQWNVGLIHTPQAEFLENPSDFGNIHWMPLKSRRFFNADPFITGKDGKVYILYESFDYKTRKGIINICTYSKEKGYSEPEVLLEKPHHLSYPYIFKKDDEIYFIPEECAGSVVNLYRLDTESLKPVFVRTLLDGIKATDTSLFHYDNYYWLLCTLQDHDSNTHLYIWYADSLKSVFITHHNNPVKTDISSARPAGAIFKYGDILCRPVQDCSALYGGSVRICEILHLSANVFHEEELFTIQPFHQSPYPHGLHTLNHYGPYVVIDSKRLCFIWDSFKYKLQQKIFKLFY